MSNRDQRVRLQLEVTSEASAAAAEVADLGDAYRDMATEADRASQTTRDAADRMDGAAESTDNLASKAGQATGGLGALAAGFELVGADKYAERLEQAAMATDFLSGVGDIANLMLSTKAGRFVIARTATIAHTVATRASTAATRAQTIAQRALNLVMRANPIGLIITAVLALVAGFVLLYKRSETFRAIVQAVGRAGQKALGWIVDVAKDVGRWIGDNVPEAARRMRDLVVGYVRFVTTPWRVLIDVLRDVIGWVRDRIPGAVQAMKDAVSGALDKVLAPFRAIRDAVQEIVDLIGKIKIPDLPNLPDLNPFSRSAAPTGRVPVDGGVAPTVVNNINVTGGVIDAPGVARTIEQLLRDRAVQLGYQSA